MNETNIEMIFLGGMYPKELEKEIVNNTRKNSQQAANILQWGLVEGIESWSFDKVHVISALYIGTFPRAYKKIVIQRGIWSHGEDTHDDLVGFVNIFGIKEIFRSYETFHTLKNYIDSISKSVVVIFIYALNTALLQAAVKVKSDLKDKQIHICLICPDLPQFMNIGQNRGFLFEKIKNIDYRRQMKLLKDIDSYVFLTKFMNEKLNTENKPWCVVEGIANTVEISCDIQKNNIHTMLYSGGICEEYGVFELIETFGNLKNMSWKLCLCGQIDEQIVKKYKYKNVEFLGSLPNMKVRELQKKADLLINPRRGDEEYTRYSFPSKTIEYMMSGTAVLMYELEGVPEDYYKYVYTVEKNGNSLKNALKNMMELDIDILEAKGMEALKYVTQKKNPRAQGKKIVDMVMEVL